MVTEARLLIVDDEPSLLELLKRYLERLGYQVETVATPEAALEEFQADPRRFTAVLTDLSLPGMSGEELAHELRARNPSLPVVISSGYPFEPQSKGIYFIQKPYVPRALAELLEKVLKNPARETLYPSE